jgi:hypothetical protein
MKSGRRWTVHDHYGHIIYLTHERWMHITEDSNHPEMLDYENELQETIRSGQRKQDVLNPHKYRYSKAFDVLAGYNTHIVAIVLFRLSIGPNAELMSNNYIVTAYQKEIG